MLFPVGPERPAVYWRRRVVVLVVLVVLLYLLLRACGGSGNDTPTVSTTPKPTGTTGSAGTPASRPTTTSSAVPTRAATSSRPTATRAVALCRDSDIKVSIQPNAKSYAAGSDPRFTLSVSNISGTPCRRDVGSKALEVVVTSGNDDIWSSDTCRPAGTSDLVTLAAGKSFSTTVTWRRIRVSNACATSTGGVTAGTYRVQGRADKVHSGTASFILG